MKVSMNWLNDYVNIKEENYEIVADKMLLAGNEYAEIKKSPSSSNLVIGLVTKKEKHPNSDKLSVCYVDLGEGVIEQIVCGALNVAENKKVIVAKIGALLPNNLKIEEITIRGVKSKGMICALEELGIEAKYIKEENKGGIHILDDDAPIGENAIEYLHFNDTIIDFELTANRSDLLSMIGMAYEIGALLKKEVSLPINKIKEEESIDDYVLIDGKTDKAPVYLSRLVKDVVIQESPNFIKARLIAAGIRPINNVIDISNYVMLEYGQPLHFFDYDKLGSKVIIRMAKKDEKIITLDNQERLLDEKDIVIASETEAVALAGIMGGLKTEVTSLTTNILIESAVFDSVSIRNTSKKQLKSEASIRFEKGIDANATKEALDRAAYLLQKYASGRVLKGIAGYNNINLKDKVIGTCLAKIKKILGVDISLSKVKEVLDRLQFKYDIKDDSLIVYVPSRRLDINIEEDIIEEIGRIYGYKHIIGILPQVTMKTGKYNPKYKIIKKIKTRLEALGLNEVRTYSLNNDSNDKWIDEKVNQIYIQSPMSEDRKILRHNLVSSLLEVSKYNTHRNNKDINIFEVGSVYYQAENKYIEETKLSLLMTGNYITNSWQKNIFKVDFYILKGVIENLLNYLGFNGCYEFKEIVHIKELHPYKSAEIWLNGNNIGYMGAIHKTISKLPLYVLELSIDQLLSSNINKIKYKPVSIYPSINKDLSFIVAKNISIDQIIKVIKKSGSELLIDVDVFDVYEGDNIEEAKKSVAFNLTFADSKKTLTDKIVNDLLSQIINTIKEELKGELRSK